MINEYYYLQYKACPNGYTQVDRARGRSTPFDAQRSLKDFTIRVGVSLYVEMKQNVTTTVAQEYTVNNH